MKNKVQNLETLAQTKFLSLYNANYINKGGNKKTWTIATRKSKEALEDQFFNGKEDKVDAVVIVAFHKSEKKLVLVKQFRVPINDYIYELPAGLVDQGEDALNSLKRELKEEIGLDITVINPRFLTGLDEELLNDYFKIKVTKPVRGKLKNLVDLARENAKEQFELEGETLKQDEEERYKALSELKELLGLKDLRRIESFDNSHLFGTFYVGGMVVFDDFLPNKDLYRKYKISTDVKDDLGAMKEVIYRRYFKVLMEESYTPDLIVMDGGQLQISACKEVLDSLNLHIPIIGLVKDDKHRTNHIMNENYEILEVNKDSKLFLFLTRIQEEVHRYAITYHRNIKAKGALTSILDMVPGIGEVRKKELLKKFGSLKKMKEASVEELSSVVTREVAEKLFEYLKEV